MNDRILVVLKRGLSQEDRDQFNKDYMNLGAGVLIRSSEKHKDFRILFCSDPGIFREVWMALCEDFRLREACPFKGNVVPRSVFLGTKEFLLNS
jgi:hypothetical protein